MTNVRESSSRQASTADALDGVNLNPHTRASAKAQLLRAEAMVDGAERVVLAVYAALMRIGELSAAWRLKTVPRS
jgi:hypothetical protein